MTRLIDADALKRALITNGFRNDIDMMMTLETINNSPTVDAVPVKRGHWIETEENHGFDDEVRNKALSCSVCRVAFRISDYALIEDFRYCPNCGADMRETHK